MASLSLSLCLCLELNWPSLGSNIAPSIDILGQDLDLDTVGLHLLTIVERYDANFVSGPYLGRSIMWCP